MRSKKTQVEKSFVPVQRQIPIPPLADSIKPRDIEAAAVAAAAMRQLNRCAKEIETFVKASQMETILQEIQKDLDAENPHAKPKLRLHGECL